MSTEILATLPRYTISWLEKAAFQVMFISIKYPEGFVAAIYKTESALIQFFRGREENCISIFFLE